MKNEQEIVRSVFDAYIRDVKATSTKKDRPTFDMLEEVKNRAIKALEQQPSDDCVSRQTIIDMTGLSNWFESSDDYNSFVEELCKLPPVTPKIPTSDDCVSRAEVFEIMGNLMSIPYDFDRPINDDDVSESMDKIKALPPVTPTHGTCQDCKYWDSSYTEGINHLCKKYGKYTHYHGHCIGFTCADFEKRGNENGSN